MTLPLHRAAEPAAGHLRKGDEQDYLYIEVVRECLGVLHPPVPNQTSSRRRNHDRRWTPPFLLHGEMQLRILSPPEVKDEEYVRLILFSGHTHYTTMMVPLGA